MVVKLDKVSFEEALNMTGFGKFNYLAFMLCSTILIGQFFELMSVSYLVPGSQCELNTTSAQQGIIAGIPLVGVIITSHFWGYLADTKGRRFTLCVSNMMAFTAGALAAISPNWIVLSVFKFFASAAASSGSAVSMTLLSETTPMKNRSTFILLTTSAYMLAYGIMAVIAAPVLALKFSYPVPYLNIEFNAWRLLNIIFALPTALGSLGVVCTYESPKYLLSVGKHKETLEVLRGIFRINSGKDADLYRVNSIILEESAAKTAITGFWTSIKAQTLPLFKPPLLKHSLTLTVLFISVYICVNPLMVWLPFMVNAFIMSVENGDGGITLCEMINLSQNATRVTNSTAAIEASQCTMNQNAMTLVFIVCLLISAMNLITSSIMRCTGRKMFFIGIQVLTAVTSLTLNLGRIWALSAVGFLVCLLGSINFGSLSSFCVDIYPTNIRAMAFCVTLMFGRGSAVIGINLMKKLIDTDCESCFYILGAISLIGAIAGCLIPSDKELQKIKDAVKTQALEMSTTTKD